MRIRTLLPSLVAIAVLGMTPVGSTIAAAAGTALKLPSWLCLAGAYAFVIGGGSVAISIVRLFVENDEPANVDSFSGIDDRNGQRFFTSLLLVTLALGVLTIAFSMENAFTVGFALAAGVFGIAPEWVVGTRREQPTLSPFDPKFELGVETSHKPGACQIGDVFQRTYSWIYESILQSPDGRRSYSMRLEIPASEFSVFTARRHLRPGADGEPADVLPQYVTEGMSDDVVKCAVRVAREARAADLPYLEFIDFILSFVRDGIGYASDNVLYKQMEYVAYPVETLVHKLGDCDDHAVLAAAILVALGIDTILIIAPQHLAIGVAVNLDRQGRWVAHRGRKYYYGEATPAGDWRLGEIPAEYDVRDLIAVSLSTRPVEE